MLYSYRTYRLIREADTSRLDSLLAGLDDFGGGKTSHEDADDFMNSLQTPQTQDPRETAEQEAADIVKKLPKFPAVLGALQKHGFRIDHDLHSLQDAVKAFLLLLKSADPRDEPKIDKITRDMLSKNLDMYEDEDILKYIAFMHICPEQSLMADDKPIPPKATSAAQIRQQLMDERNPTEDEAIEMLQQYIAKINPPYHKDGMPQIPEISYMTGRFDAMLGHHNITRSNMTVKVDQIEPLQKDINYNQVKRMMNKGYKDKPLLVIDEGGGAYKLIDGHHKWAAIWCKMQMHPDMPGGKEWNQVSITVLKPPRNISTKQVLGILAQISQTIKDKQEAEGSLTMRKEMEARKSEIDAMAARFLDRFKTVGDMASEPEPQPAPTPASQPAVTQPVEKAAAPTPVKKRGFASRYSGFASRFTQPAQPAVEPTPAPAPEPTPPPAPAKKRGFASRLAPKTESRKRRSWFFG